jgi:hypothetical protein
MTSYIQSLLVEEKKKVYLSSSGSLRVSLYPVLLLLQCLAQATTDVARSLEEVIRAREATVVAEAAHAATV